MSAQKVPCKICGKSFTRITAAHLKQHGIKLKEYQFLFGDSSDEVTSCQFTSTIWGKFACNYDTLGGNKKTYVFYMTQTLQKIWIFLSKF